MTRLVLLGAFLVGAGTFLLGVSLGGAMTLCKIIPQLAWACGASTTTTTTLQPPVSPPS